MYPRDIPSAYSGQALGLPATTNFKAYAHYRYTVGTEVVNGTRGKSTSWQLGQRIDARPTESIDGIPAFNEGLDPNIPIRREQYIEIVDYFHGDVTNAVINRIKGWTTDYLDRP